MLAYNLNGVDGVWDSISSAASAAVGAIKGAANTACGIVQNSSVQQGAAVAALVAGGAKGSQITQGAAYANAACDVVNPPASSAPSSTKSTTFSAMIKQAANAAALIKPIASGASSAKYKAGSMARFNRTRGVWSIYSPLAGAGLFGVISDGRCMGGVCLGDGEVTPAVPAGFVKAGEELAPPAGVTQAGEEEDKKPFYKNPVYWAIAGGAVALGTGGYFLLRKKSGGLNGARRRRRR